MKTDVQKILHFKRFFNIIQSNDKIIKYSLEKPSKILLQNIYSNWLQSILLKTNKNFTVYLNDIHDLKKPEKVPYSYVNRSFESDQNIYEYDWDGCAPKRRSELRFNLIVPREDNMQYFIQWQRYRKFWWSSITSTPSLFGIDETNHGENTVNIVAKFHWGPEIVETLNITSENAMIQGTSHLSCAMPLEKALFVLLLDGLTSSTKEGYLRLHRKMAPFKMSFMLEEASKNEGALQDLANLLHCRLARNKISTLLPDFSNENQLQENLQMGVAYTIVLSDKTLSDGIFHLLNSSTMLKEQVHVADFDSYAALICEKGLVNNLM